MTTANHRRRMVASILGALFLVLVVVPAIIAWDASASALQVSGEGAGCHHRPRARLSAASRVEASK